MKKKTNLLRAAMTLLMAVLTVAVAWADNVDEKQAQELAQQFLKNHQAVLGRKSTPKLTLEKEKVSGLYVFNVENKGGFIIVSNDDQTKPILGFGESGNIDTKNIPANMRAWLQGYADEIAWLQQHGGKAAKARASAPARAPQRVGSHSTANIPPLVSTQWNQSTPYWNLCPYYYSTNRAATGCVATAMAQVMKYHEWPKEDTENNKDGYTKIIPGYTTQSYQIVLSELPAIKFDWENMLGTYSANNYNTAQATAVATLMQYCGYSVEMDYGPSSGSNTFKVADALKAYFDYNETVTYVQRSFYTYANWTDMIYHELSNRRPVVYGGQSSGGGHEFVCDGYKYESETDFFHINWGWGGTSDNYFVLSALDPDVQGIGGSSSNDGFHYGQDAVIGIQKSTASGTIANITPNTVGLSLNSVTFSAHPTQGEVVTVNIDLKNSSGDVWDGDIGIRLFYHADNQWNYVDDISSNFFIPANTASTICQLTFTPEYSGQYGIKVYRPSVNAGYINWIGYNNNGEPTAVTVVPPLSITDLTVTSAPTSATVTWTGNEAATNYNLRYRVAKTFRYDFESAEPWAVDDFIPFTTYDGDGLPTYSISDATFPNQSYTGSVIAFQNGITSNFKSYSGNAFGCFMDAIPSSEVTTNNDWFITPEVKITEGSIFSFWARSNTATYGLERFKVGIYGNTPGTFTAYLAGGADTFVEAPTSWTKYNYDLSAYAGQTIRLAINCVSEDAFAFYIDDIYVGNPNDDSDWTTITGVASPYQLTELTPETNYELQVQGVYDEDLSAWSASANFTTPSPCDVPNTLDVTDVTHESATLSWTGYQDSYNLRYRTSGGRKVYVFDDFESGDTDAWTQNDGIIAHFEDNDNNFVLLGYNNTAYPQYLISPKLPALASGSTVEFYQRRYQSDTTFKLGFSSTTANVDAFTWGDEQAAATSYTLFSEVIPAGTKYIAIQTTAAAQENALLIDDCGIYGPTVEEGEWVTATTDETTLAITGLATDTKYEWQVQGISEACGGTTDWSAMVTFTTLDHLILSDAADDNDDIIRLYNRTYADVTLANRTLYQDGDWNTLCLPFNVTDGDTTDGKTFTGTQLEGAKVMEVDTDNAHNGHKTGVEGSTLYLNFIEATTIEAGKPYIVKWADGNDVTSPAFKGVTINGGSPVTVTSDDDNLSFVGTYSPVDIYTTDKTNLYLGSGSKLYYPSAAPFHVNAFRAYFTLNNGITASDPKSIRAFVLNFGDNEDTGITTTDYTDYANSAEDLYTLDGRKVGTAANLDRQKSLRRGVYILRSADGRPQGRNGRKMVIH